MSKMKEIWQQMKEENWEGTSEEYLHQYNENELKRKRNNGEIYYVLHDKEPHWQVVAFEGIYTECEKYISNKENPNKYGIIWDMDEDGNFTI